MIYVPTFVPVIADTVQYTRRITPRTGAAIGGKLEIHAALVVRVAQVQDNERRPESWTCDLRVHDGDGDSYFVRGARYSPRAGVDGAVATYGADAAYTVDELDGKLREYAMDRSTANP